MIYKIEEFELYRLIDVGCTPPAQVGPKSLIA
jgi:hypothetical protein